ncbi:hypothetical protein ED312_14435 [Sinomicrobium pectinilyticum]|uniref:Uncharacterized protein n=1 Tax=Sinomicrobium pectinilyticum TaxID=1084421 RepID=A0A3N0E826_SINP1|nr:hypothetical protein ED312_14435 [Sinomicrobium pectinilyticum]
MQRQNKSLFFKLLVTHGFRHFFMMWRFDIQGTSPVTPTGPPVFEGPGCFSALKPGKQPFKRLCIHWRDTGKRLTGKGKPLTGLLMILSITAWAAKQVTPAA